MTGHIVMIRWKPLGDAQGVSLANTQPWFTGSMLEFLKVVQVGLT